MSEIVKGMGVEWEGSVDGVSRFGVVMSKPREADGFPGVMIVDCTTDTFAGDPLCTVPVEVSRLRERVRPHPLGLKPAA